MKKLDKQHKTCFYCGSLVSNGSGHGDHFPIPERNGGTETVDCCLGCHDMKDRYTLHTWPTDWTSKVVEDFPKMSRETRLFLSKAMSLMSDVLKTKERGI